eukprot:gene39397-53264_t
MQALSEIVQAGKVRYIGFSEWSPDQIEAAFAIPGVERFVSSQPQYSLLWRRPEAKVIPICKAHDVSQIVWSPLAQGVLTGKYLPGQPHLCDARGGRPSVHDGDQAGQALSAGRTAGRHRKRSQRYRHGVRRMRRLPSGRR